MKFIIWSILTLCWASTSAVAGAKIRMETLKDRVTQQVGWVYIEGENWLRIDTNVDIDTDKPEDSMIFQADADKIYMVDHDAKEYICLDKEAMRKVANRMNETVRQMQEQLDNMPKAQRKIMQDMWEKNMPQSPGEGLAVDVRPMGMDGDYEKYELWVGDEKMSEVWAASPEKMGIPANSLEVFRKMSAFYEELRESLSNNPFFQSMGTNPFPGFAEMNGFPVRTRDVQAGTETHVSEATTTDLVPEFFNPPEEYRRKEVEVE
jgi:hypothetical protein